MSYCHWTKSLHSTHAAPRTRKRKPKPAPRPSRFSTHSHFRQEIGLGSREGVCANCRMPFDDHYNGACPKDENE